MKKVNVAVSILTLAILMPLAVQSAELEEIKGTSLEVSFNQAEATQEQNLDDSSGPDIYLTVDDLPHCDAEEPSLTCIQSLFLPLNGTDWPFDSDLVNDALEPADVEISPGFYVAPAWKLTVLHGIEVSSLFPSDCYFSDYAFATENNPIQQPGCGEFLFVGGHPHAMTCKQMGTPVSTCVDQVPVEDAFDIGLLAATGGGRFLQLASSISVGEEIFLVGFPSFPWLSRDERASFEGKYPLVSYGHVVDIDGKGIVTSNLGFGGSSGGPMLNRAGEVVGIVYTKVGHIRAQGTATKPSLEDRHEVGVILDTGIKDSIRSVQP